jgi:hypothetical protein
MAKQTTSVNQRAHPNDLAIRIKIGSHIGINQSILKVLNQPSHLNFWWGEDEKVLAICSTNEPVDLSVYVPDYFYRTKRGSKIMNYRLIKRIQSLTAWEAKSSHVLVGEFIPELRMIVFRVREERFRDGDYI